jgi:hypothetical protein
VLVQTADEDDVENTTTAEQTSLARPAPPSLPPRTEPATNDVWQGVEAEPDSLHHHLPLITEPEPHTWLLPSRAAATLATIGLAGGVVANILILSALMPAFDTGDTRNYVISLDESRWFAATFVVSGLLTYMGWLWWSMSAAFNVRRVTPLGTSPWLPTLVYLGGPTIWFYGQNMTGNSASTVVFIGAAWLGLGHIAVIASFRNAAGRIGASTDAFSMLIWLPLASVSYRLAVMTALEYIPESAQRAPLLLAFGAIGVLFLVGIAVSTWQATTAFDSACHRLNTRNLGAGLPSVDVITSALRRAAQH